VQQLDPALPEATRYAIAEVIYDQYKPESMDDSVPRSVEGAVLSIADKADSIAGMFALGMIPSGSKDPFALRRQANGIVKIIAEHKLDLRTSDIFENASKQYEGSEAEKKFKSKNFADEINGFFCERLEFYLKEARGFAYDVVNAVLAAGADDIVDAIARAEAVAQVRGSEDFQAIGAAFKRIKNILRQADEKKIAPATTFNVADATEDAEKALGSVMTKAKASIAETKGDYIGSLKDIAQVRQPVDNFLDKLMVMVDDPKVRANRLALLRDLLSDFSTIADFSEIVAGK
jgi:glycyl-tRNA synthetase beta chain